MLQQSHSMYPSPTQPPPPTLSYRRGLCAAADTAATLQGVKSRRAQARWQLARACSTNQHTHTHIHTHSPAPPSPHCTPLFGIGWKCRTGFVGVRQRQQAMHRAFKNLVCCQLATGLHCAKLGKRMMSNLLYYKMSTLQNIEI